VLSSKTTAHLEEEEEEEEEGGSGVFADFMSRLDSLM